MIKAIMAIDDHGGVSKGASMPWPKNTNDLKWFKKNTLAQVVIMGRKTWEDPFMPTPLKDRTNVLITKKNTSHYPGADFYINGNIIDKIIDLEKDNLDKDIFIIGGPEIINQCFELFKEFYLTRIYGNFYCEKFIDLSKIERKMKLSKKIKVDETCHFEIWKK